MIFFRFVLIRQSGRYTKLQKSPRKAIALRGAFLFCRKGSIKFCPSGSTPLALGGQTRAAFPAGKNPTSEPRYATLTVKGGNAPEKYVMVTQLAGTVVPEAKTLTADVSLLTFEAKGETKTIKITSNTTWNITNKPDWCVLSESSGSGNKSITVTANENTKTQDRSAQIVIEGDGVSKVVIDVTQKAKELQEPGSDDNTPPA